MKCIAYRDDGRICGAPASNVDAQRGGMVCDAHRPGWPVTTETQGPVGDPSLDDGLDGEL